MNLGTHPLCLLIPAQAMTRAAALLVLVGDPYVLMEEPHWRDCLEYAAKLGCYEGVPLDSEEYVRSCRSRAYVDRYTADRQRQEEQLGAAQIDDDGFLQRLVSAKLANDCRRWPTRQTPLKETNRKNPTHNPTSRRSRSSRSRRAHQRCRFRRYLLRRRSLRRRSLRRRAHHRHRRSTSYHRWS